MGDARREPAGDLTRVIGWLAVLWAVYILQIVLKAGFDYSLIQQWGLHPRSLRGLVGILTAPLLHAGWAHIVSNTLALLILGWLACGYSRRLAAGAVTSAVLVSGAFTWLVASSTSVHVGASGVVFGLIGFLITNGLVRRGCVPLIITGVVTLLFGGAVLTVLRAEHDGQLLSWQMHLGGLVGGIAAAWATRRQKA